MIPGLEFDVRIHISGNYPVAYVILVVRIFWKKKLTQLIEIYGGSVVRR